LSEYLGLNGLAAFQVGLGAEGIYLRWQAMGVGCGRRIMTVRSLDILEFSFL
jgi:hypothetical protein